MLTQLSFLGVIRILYLCFKEFSSLVIHTELCVYDAWELALNNLGRGNGWDYRGRKIAHEFLIIEAGWYNGILYNAL